MNNLISECKILTIKMNNMYMQYLDSIQMLHLDATSNIKTNMAFVMQRPCISAH